ncbi:hypothetical protein [Zobellella denitrificans]|uniref:hypothetical protein n=1 Tax=Zobellella denitrificans TaxID=347534 RepID=UPI0012FDC537|nr:hypothetical protein [Zobellella denitrificans]
MLRFFSFLIAFLIPFSVFSQANPYYVPAQVHSVTGIASVTTQQITTNAIGKGFAANDPFRPVQAKVTPAKLLQFAKANGGHVLKTNLWWIAATVALGYVIDEFGNVLSHSGTLSPSMSASGKCEASATSFLANYGTKTLSQCFDILFSLVHPADCGGTCTYDSFKFYPQNDNTVFSYHLYWQAPSQIKMRFSNFSPPADYVYEPVSDSDFTDAILPYITANPSPDIFGDDPSQVDWEPLEYNPYAPNPYGAGLMDLYRQGLLQSSDPNGDYYVTPEQYEEVAQWVASQDRALSPDGIADALNDALKSPLTQHQLAEELAKNRQQQQEQDVARRTAEFTDATSQFNEQTEPSKDALDQKKQDLDDFIADIPDLVGSDIPGTPGGISGVPFPSNWATGMNGACMPLVVSLSVRQFSTTTTWDGHCPIYDSVFRPVITWFLYLMTALYLFRLWDDTVTRATGV